MDNVTPSDAVLACASTMANPNIVKLPDGQADPFFYAFWYGMPSENPTAYGAVQPRFGVVTEQDMHQNLVGVNEATGKPMNYMLSCSFMGLGWGFGNFNPFGFVHDGGKTMNVMEVNGSAFTVTSILDGTNYVARTGNY